MPALSGQPQQESGDASDEDSLTGAVPSLTRGQSLPEAMFSSVGPEFWRNLHRLPVLPSVPSRQRATNMGRRAIDWPRSTRGWLKSGHLSTRYVAQAKFSKPGRMVVLWDVSGSMAGYLGLYLPWLWRLVQLSPQVGVFPFGTRMDEVTALLRQPFRAAVASLTKLNQVWVGGTSIGAMFAEFSERFAQKWLRGRTTIVVISDGWDVGDPDVIATQMRRWKQQDARVYWLNPLAATPGFEPRTRALLAAKPYIERIESGHNPQALMKLVLR